MTSEISISDRAWRVALVVIGAVAAAIRLHALDRFSYGLDEILQTYWMNGTWSFFWKSIRFDAGHPPLDYLIARVWQEVHPSDAVRKLPVVVFGTATVIVFAHLVGRRTGRAAGLVGAALLAFAPFHVRYSQEIRPYSLALLLLCASLLCLDRLIERTNWPRLVTLFLACLATVYTSYIPQIILGLAGLGILVTDSFDSEPSRRLAARRLLRWSPAFLFVLWLAYLPWWPVQLEAASRRLSLPPAAPLSWARVGRITAFFSTSSDGSDPFRIRDTTFVLLALWGAVLATRRERARFLLVWGLGGLGVIEVLWRIHPHWDVARIFLPAGVALVALAALPVAGMLQSRGPAKLLALACVATVLFSDSLSVRSYFASGRADWRPLARFLRERPPEEWVFTENAYTSLCLAFYIVGPESMYFDHSIGRPVLSLEGKPEVLVWSWPRETTTWVVTGPGDRSERLRDWLRQFPSFEYPAAEGSVLYRLDPSVRESAFAGEHAPRR